MVAPADRSAQLLGGGRDLLPACGSTVVVCVSGGADSVALLRMLHALDAWRLVVFHLDHGLRAESAADARWVAGLCHDLGLTCAIATIALREVARDRKQGLEQAGREERYRRVAALARQLPAQAILTAHHRDDQVETVLMHVLRGAGATGARGVPPRRDCAGTPLVRPLLHIPRAQLHDYLHALGQGWREDGSNRDLALRRNALRHRVLPLVEAAEPGFSQALLRWSQAQSDGDGAGGVLYHLLRAHGLEPSRERVRRLRELDSGAAGEALHLGHWLVRRMHGGLQWQDLRVAPTPEPAPVRIAGPGSALRGASCLLLRLGPQPDAAALRTRPGEAWLDQAALAWPLTWRPAEPGDWWQPLGAPGRQRVFKTFADRKLPRARRAQVAVLSDCHGVVWIPGLGISQRVRVQPGSSSVLHGWVLPPPNLTGGGAGGLAP